MGLATQTAVSAPENICSTYTGKNKLYDKNLEAAIKLSARHGGWSLSLTSSGEPTCDPDALTSALQIYQKCAQQGAYFPNVNLFTNGILFWQRKIL